MLAKGSGAIWYKRMRFLQWVPCVLKPEMFHLYNLELCLWMIHFPSFAFLFIFSHNINKYCKQWLLLHAVENSENAVTSPPFIITQTVRQYNPSSDLFSFESWGPREPWRTLVALKKQTNKKLVPKQIIKEIINAKLSFSCLLLLFFCCLLITLNSDVAQN